MGRAKTDKGEEKKKKKKKRREEGRKKEKRRSKVWKSSFFCMDAMDFVWIHDFVWKNQTINPFLMNF